MTSYNKRDAEEKGGALAEQEREALLEHVANVLAHRGGAIVEDLSIESLPAFDKITIIARCTMTGDAVVSTCEQSAAGIAEALVALQEGLDREVARELREIQENRTQKLSDDEKETAAVTETP